MKEALEKYDLGDYPGATALFFALLLRSPLNSCLWGAFASSVQMEQKYAEALRAWGICSALHPQDPVPHFYRAQCYSAQGLPDEAVRSLEQALALPCPIDWVEKINFMKGRLVCG